MTVSMDDTSVEDGEAVFEEGESNVEEEEEEEKEEEDGDIKVEVVTAAVVMVVVVVSEVDPLDSFILSFVLTFTFSTSLGPFFCSMKVFIVALSFCWFNFWSPVPCCAISAVLFSLSTSASCNLLSVSFCSATID